MKIKNIQKKDLICYLVGFIIVGIIFLIIIVLIVSSITQLGDSYQKVLQECVNKGYDISYCKSLLN